MREKNENNTQSQDGWYEHKETGAIVHLQDDPDYGVPLTNSFIKAGYVFVGDEDPRKVSEEEVETTSQVKTNKKRK